MDALIQNLGIGFAVALTPWNLVFALIGCLLGTLIGVLPGIGPLATIAMLLPFTFKLDPTGALIMLAGIYYGAQYGGSTTAILVNLPGEAASVVTTLDGYQMARQGKAGTALTVAAIGSFFAGCVGTVAIALLAPPLVAFAQLFGPAEYFSLMVLGLTAAVVLAHGSLVKAVAMVVLGLLLGLIGTDVNNGVQRFTFGIHELSDGLGFVPIAMGLFGVAEIVMNLARRTDTSDKETAPVGSLFPSREDWKTAWGAILRGTGFGGVLGVLPGGGAVLASFASYTLEKKIAKDPSRFGKGAIEGVAGPEAANNAGAQTSFIPMLSLGIPSNAVMALMIGAMTIHGIQPGPQVMGERAEVFWGMIASMWIGNLMLVIVNLPLVGVWVKLLQMPYRLLFPIILVFCCIGTYSVNNSAVEVVLMAGFGVFGVVLLRLGFEPAPLLLGYVLGPLMEENLRRAMLIGRGDPTVFVTRPLSATLLFLAAALFVALALPALRKKREEVFVE
ncbi:MAG: tripartite tricarboxylate transporter permease [Alphaproteobacteria bacterium]|nr:tripartite tricarboxylate transporter permease [Alphaproteobacteria bacterium]